MAHYYDEWNKTLSRNEILGELELTNEEVKRYERFIEDVHHYLEKGLSAYVQRSLKNDLVNLNIKLGKAKKRATQISNKLAKHDSGEVVKGIEIC